MGFWDIFKDGSDYDENDEYEDDEDVVEVDEEEEAPHPRKRKSRAERPEKKPSHSSKESGYNITSFDRPAATPRSSYRSAGASSKVVDIHTTAKLQVVLTKPEKFSDAKEIADNLNEKRTIVLNLESTSKDEALRLLDFLSGVAYANDGEIKKIAKSTFIITPYNVDVMGDLLYELESNGVFFV